MVYLDNAATSFPKPPTVIKAMNRAVEFYGANPGRSGHFLSMYAAGEIYKCREKAAQLFNALAAEYIIFTQNATHAINLAVKGALKPGAHVIMSDLEHNSVIRPVTSLEKIGVYFDKAEVCMEDDEQTLKSFKSKIRKDTKAIICTHASNVWGRILPVEKIGALAKENGLLFIVDASQTAGNVKIDMKQMNIDILCLPGHKGLYGPQGTGIMALGSDICLEPLIYGGTGTNSYEAYQPDEAPERYESGTLNTPGISGLCEGISFVLSNGYEKYLKTETEIMDFLYEELSKMKNVFLYTKYNKDLYANVLSFNIKDRHSNEIAEYLDAKDILVRSGLHCSPFAHAKMGTVKQGAVRVSIGAFNSMLDAERLVQTVKTISDRI